MTKITPADVVAFLTENNVTNGAISYHTFKAGSSDAHCPRNGVVIYLTSTDYVNANADNGFYIYVPSTATGAIKVDTLGGQTLTITDYATNAHLRSARFAKVYKTGTVATGLEAWY